MARKIQVEPATNELSIEYVRLDELAPADLNPKEHDLQAIAAAIEFFKMVVPAARDESTGKLVAGHGTAEVLGRLHKAGRQAPTNVQVDEDGMWMMPILAGASFPDEDSALAYLIADNALTARGGWREAALYTALSRFVDVDAKLIAASGFLDYLPGLRPLDTVEVDVARQSAFTIRLNLLTSHVDDARPALLAIAEAHPDWGMTIS